jgi:hypothetical protein
MSNPKDISAPLTEAASKSATLTQQAGDLIGKSALVATHAALTLARGAVASADTVVKKYLPAGTAPARVARKAKKARAKVKRKGRKAVGKEKQAARRRHSVVKAAKSAVKSRKKRAAKRGRR